MTANEMFIETVEQLDGLCHSTEEVNRMHLRIGKLIVLKNKLIAIYEIKLRKSTIKSHSITHAQIFQTNL
jgi:hypothetical protein